MSAAFTMLDFAAERGNLQQQGIVKAFAEESSVIPFANVRSLAGPGEPYSREGTLPEVYERLLTEEKTATTGRDQNEFEALKILTVPGSMDRAEKEMAGGNGSNNPLRSKALARAARSMAHKFDYNFINGDKVANPAQFDGLKAMATGSQVINCTAADGTTTNGGDVLRLYDLNRALRYLKPKDRRRTVIFMNPDLKLILSEVMERAHASNQPVEMAGRVFDSYRGYPVGELDEDHKGNDILPFDEPAAENAATSTSSIYIVTFGEDETSIIQSLGGPRQYPRTDGSMEKDDLEWLVAVVRKRPEALVRLKNIKLALPS